jgi:hypothetical protein
MKRLHILPARQKVRHKIRAAVFYGENKLNVDLSVPVGHALLNLNAR